MTIEGEALRARMRADMIRAIIEDGRQMLRINPDADADQVPLMDTANWPKPPRT